MKEMLFGGRMSRRNFIWSQVILVGVVTIPILWVLNGDFTLEGLLASLPALQTTLLILAPLALSFQFICSFRRLHDINQSGLWALLLLSSLALIPLVNMAFLIYISYKKGAAQNNDYGTPDTRPLFDSILNKENKGY